MLTENDVVEAVAGHLRAVGYTIDGTCSTTQPGVDIVARMVATGRCLRVEAKGGTSSKEHTARYSRPFDSGQVLSHVSRAFFKAASMLGQYPEDDVALALPDDQLHQARVDEIRPALDKLNVSVFFVADDRSVRVDRPASTV